MNEPRILSGLSDIAADYEALFCDAWGVIHNGRALFPGVTEALRAWRAARGPVIIITNAPRLSSEIPPQLDRLGLPRDAYDRVVTSGDATRAKLLEHPDDALYRLGPAKDDTLFDSLPQRFVDFQDARRILCTGLIDDQHDTPDDYRDLLAAAAARRLPMICANPDKVVKYGDRLIYCAGALGDLYEELGGEVILCGKPHAPIYELCRHHARELTGAATPRCLAIGDGVQTDIKGANDQDLDVVFVADGIFSEQSRDADGRLDAGRLSALLADHSVHAEFALDGLRW
jgi:HAD superfamily hydrolase (TIGR01459 family)